MIICLHLGTRQVGKRESKSRLVICLTMHGTTIGLQRHTVTLLQTEASVIN